MDVIGRTGLNEALRSPLYELQKKQAGPFDEECELLVETSNAPVVIDPVPIPTNFSEQDPTALIGLLAALNWSQVPSHPPYQNLQNAYQKYNGPAGFPPTPFEVNINGTKVQNNGQTIFPDTPQPPTLQGRWQDIVVQYSAWRYDPAIFLFGAPGGKQYWNNSLAAHRCRWRANRTVSGFRAQAVLYYATNSPDLTRWIISPYEFGEDEFYMIASAGSISPFTLPANQWMEMPTPTPPSGAQMANRHTGVVGYVWFAVHSESQSAWSARTGVPFV